jgi:RimJ/RimL family protein N-acetyltransferase
VTHLKVRAYEPKDFVSIVLPELARLSHDGQCVEEWALYHQDHGPTCTVIDPDGAVVFCAGAHIRWHGMAEVWASFSLLARKYARTWHMVRVLIDNLYLHWECERIQAVVDPRWTEAVRIAERLGFKKECTMAKYGPNGQDMDLYALIGGRKDG